MNTIYETEKFCLVPFLEIQVSGNKSNYYQWFNDQKVCEYSFHSLFPYSESEEEAWRKKIANNEIIVWAVMAKEKYQNDSGTQIIHIGNISLQSINWINRSAELAIVIGEKEYWGKGYATDSLRILIEHGFDKLNLHRIWSGTAATNKGMIIVFEKLGMRQEGTFKDAVFLEGQYVDVVCWAIVDDLEKTRSLK